MLSPEQAAALAAGELDFGLLLPPVAGAGPRAPRRAARALRRRAAGAPPAGASAERPARGARARRRSLRHGAARHRARPVRYRRRARGTRGLLPRRRAGGDPDADGGEPRLERAGRGDRAGFDRQPRPARRRLPRARRCASEARSVARLAPRRARRRGARLPRASAARARASRHAGSSEHRPDRVLDRPARGALVRPHVPRRLRRRLVARHPAHRARPGARHARSSSTTCCSSRCSA